MLFNHSSFISKPDQNVLYKYFKQMMEDRLSLINYNFVMKSKVFE